MCLGEVWKRFTEAEAFSPGSASIAHGDRDWSCGEHDGLVSIGSHSMYLNVAGPDRREGDPLVLVEAGMGDSHLSWKAVQRLIKRGHRIALYERSGIGRSETSPDGPRSATNMAGEIKQLLRAADLPGPYVIVTHSYGAVIAREFMALDPDQIAGMVLVDTEQEMSYKTLQAPWGSVHAVLGDLSYFDATKLDQEHVLLPEEWEMMKDEDEKNQPATDAEQAQSDVSCDTLAEKKQFQGHVLAGKPISVIKADSLREYSRILQAGIRAGNGTAAQRADMEALMYRMRTLEEPLQREQMQLSPNHSRFVKVDAGHNVHVTNPEVIAAEVTWVMERTEAQAQE